MIIPKIIKISGLLIILFLIIIYASIFIAYWYGAKCHCYGFKTNNKCLGINTICAGLAPTLDPTIDNDISEDCNSQKDGDLLSINFAECKSCQETIYVGFGSTTYKISKSQDGKNCIIKYGGEVENPNWDGNLNTICTVPNNIGTKAFSITNYGVDFSSLVPYCK